MCCLPPSLCPSLRKPCWVTGKSSSLIGLLPVRSAREALLLKAEPEALTSLLNQWRQGDFSALPPVVLLPASSMPGAAGAYALSTGSIYLNQDWLAGVSADQAIAVLTEELGVAECGGFAWG